MTIIIIILIIVTLILHTLLHYLGKPSTKIMENSKNWKYYSIKCYSIDIDGVEAEKLARLVLPTSPLFLFLVG